MEGIGILFSGPMAGRWEVSRPRKIMFVHSASVHLYKTMGKFLPHTDSGAVDYFLRYGRILDSGFDLD
jgi:hypothetical protein